MAKATLVALNKISLEDTPQVGVKAATLGKLQQADFPVLSGRCVSVEIFRAALRPYTEQINAVLRIAERRQLNQAAQASKQIQTILDKVDVPASVLSALESAVLESMGSNRLLAVRSSAVEEDLPEASFAGQYVTTLGVRRLPEDLRQAILACWRSYFSAGAIAARETLGLHKNFGMAVLIQPLIASECSGVCYSLDPIRPDNERAMLSATWGLGPGVVDGSLPADTFWVRRLGMFVDERRVVEKPGQIILSSTGEMVSAPTTTGQRYAACLPEVWAIRVAQFSLAIEALLGSPQEVEWAIADRQVWVLQSRPIASLPPKYRWPGPFPLEEEKEEERHRLWFLSHPSGREKDILLPLERDEFAIVEDMRYETCRFLGANRNQNMKVVNGRIYTSPAPMDIRESDLRVRHQAFQDLGKRLYEQAVTPWEYWGPEIVRATERLAEFYPAKASGQQIAEQLEDALAVRRRHYLLHPLVSVKPQPGYFEAYREVSGADDPDVEYAAYRFVISDESILSRLQDGLHQLACAARPIPELAALIAHPAPDSWARLTEIPGSEAFRSMLERFLAAYGDRTGSGYGSEATVCTPTLREQPQQVLRLIGLFLDPDSLSPAQLRQQARERRDRSVDGLCRSAAPEAVTEFQRQLAYACRIASDLEEHNHYIDQLGVGYVRQAVMAAADWLVSQEALRERTQIFWLNFSEILSALRSETTYSLQELVASRQAQHAAWSATVAWPMLGIPDGGLPERLPLRDEAPPELEQQSNLLVGQAASPGRRAGKARLPLDPTHLPDLQPGDILVAENVGPLWTPFFPVLNGLVLDGGSLGQHAATTAREYGIPTVIGTRYGTKLIRDGTWITVDGDRGIVEITVSDQP